jgi:hypothetical protein
MFRARFVLASLERADVRLWNAYTASQPLLRQLAFQSGFFQPAFE